MHGRVPKRTELCYYHVRLDDQLSSAPFGSRSAYLTIEFSPCRYEGMKFMSVYDRMRSEEKNKDWLKSLDDDLRFCWELAESLLESIYLTTTFLHRWVAVCKIIPETMPLVIAERKAEINLNRLQFEGEYKPLEEELILASDGEVCAGGKVEASAHSAVAALGNEFWYILWPVTGAKEVPKEIQNRMTADDIAMDIGMFLNSLESNVPLSDDEIATLHVRLKREVLVAQSRRRELVTNTKSGESNDFGTSNEQPDDASRNQFVPTPLQLPAQVGGSGTLTPRLRVVLEPPQITLDDTAYAVSSDGATLVNELVKADGDWVSPSKIDVTRPKRVKESLPPQILELIEAASGKGHRISRQSLGLAGPKSVSG